MMSHCNPLVIHTVKDVHPATPKTWRWYVFSQNSVGRKHTNIRFSMFWHDLAWFGVAWFCPINHQSPCTPSNSRGMSYWQLEETTCGASLAYPFQAHLLWQVLASHRFMFFEKRGLSCFGPQRWNNIWWIWCASGIAIAAMYCSGNKRQKLITPHIASTTPTFLTSTSHVWQDRSTWINVHAHRWDMWNLYDVYMSRDSTCTSCLMFQKASRKCHAMELVLGGHPLQAPWNNLVAGGSHCFTLVHGEAKTNKNEHLKTCHRDP